jgi:hypothetical protein
LSVRISDRQHAALTTERWAGFPLEQRILMIATEMNRAGKLFGSGNRGRLGMCEERILRPVDLTVETRNRPAGKKAG